MDEHIPYLMDLSDSYQFVLTCLQNEVDEVGELDIELDQMVQLRSGNTSILLSLIATIFLPLSWLTGFFGMNFGILVGHIGGLVAFIVFGLATQVAIAVALFVVFKRRGWV